MKGLVTCPMCGGGDFQPSWLGGVSFADIAFDYRECSTCASLVCDPMPDEATLTKMYGNEYFEGDAESDGTDHKKFEEVAEYLATLQPGVLIDFGCGNGELLKIAADLGWRSIGIEFNPEKIEQLKAELPFEIMTLEEAAGNIRCDVLFLGDVLEHLTDLDKQFPEIIELLKPGGVFVAIGPLEANPSIFNSVLKLNRKLSGNRRLNMAPYHVVLATTEGQRALFERNGFRETEFRTTEVAFPAAEHFSPRLVARPRQLALFLVRKLSRAMSGIGQKGMNGNRYFFAGCYLKVDE